MEKTPLTLWTARLGRAALKSLILTTLAAALGLALWTWGALTYVYSRGERAGYVQKFSKRGWVFKTWEGELAMVNLPGALTEKFEFTVRDEQVARAIEEGMGHRLVLVYHQHRGIPSRVFGDTGYFIVAVRSADIN